MFSRASRVSLSPAPYRLENLLFDNRMLRTGDATSATVLLTEALWFDSHRQLVMMMHATAAARLQFPECKSRAFWNNIHWWHFRLPLGRLNPRQPLPHWSTMANICDNCIELISVLSKCMFVFHSFVTFSSRLNDRFSSTRTARQLYTCFPSLWHFFLINLSSHFSLSQDDESCLEEDEFNPINKSDLNVLINYINVWSQK